MKHLNILFSLVFLIISLLTTKAQSPIIIDPDNYRTKSNPFVIPNLPSGSSYYLSVKGGEAIYVTINGIIKNSVTYYINSLGIQPNFESTDTVMFISKYCGSILTNYRDNNLDIYPKTLSIYFHAQADIYDRTVGSATYGKRPDFIWVNAGQSATVSGGPWMKWYSGINLDTRNIIANGAVDSTITLLFGKYVLGTDDGSGMAGSQWSYDTISILEKPTFNSTAKTLNFPTTLTGITYKVLKVGSINGTDTTWTETQNFVGDGNAKNITLTDGKYKLTTTFGIHTANYLYGYFVVGITTAIDKTKEENISFRVVDNKLQFDNEVNLKFYSLQGQLLQQEKGVLFKLVRKTGILTATDKNGNTLTTKIILK